MIEVTAAGEFAPTAGPRDPGVWSALGVVSAAVILLHAALAAGGPTTGFWTGFSNLDHGSREHTAVEYGTLLFAVLGAIVGAYASALAPGRLLKLFFAFGALVLVFIFLEESAWGQWLLEYETPALLRNLNRQGEMTLHNLGPFHGRNVYIRLALCLGGLAGIYLVPAVLRPVRVPRSLTLPLLAMTVFAAVDVLEERVDLPAALENAGGRMSEVVEMAITFVGFAYLLSHALALRARRAS